jgi:cystathionine beta-lyase/cystathionine gamma-synthase
MDDFGIGNAVRGSANVVFISSRRSGRTTRMIEAYNEGDRIIVTSRKEGERLVYLGKQLGKDIKYFINDPREPQRIYETGTPQGRTILDHSWVEKFYENTLTETFDYLKRLQIESSGYGRKHRETKESADQYNRYREWN